jgi:hypothetical protein
MDTVFRSITQDIFKEKEKGKELKRFNSLALSASPSVPATSCGDGDGGDLARSSYLRSS